MVPASNGALLNIQYDSLLLEDRKHTKDTKIGNLAKTFINYCAHKYVN